MTCKEARHQRTCQDDKRADLFDDGQLLDSLCKLVDGPSERGRHLQIVYSRRVSGQTRVRGVYTIWLVDLVDTQRPCGSADEQLVACTAFCQ